MQSLAEFFLFSIFLLIFIASESIVDCAGFHQIQGTSIQSPLLKFIY